MKATDMHLPFCFFLSSRSYSLVEEIFLRRRVSYMFSEDKCSREKI